MGRQTLTRGGVLRISSTLLHRLGRVALATLVVSAGIAGTEIPASASADTSKPTTAEIRGALDRISKGTWSESDIDLLKIIPDVGHAVPDPRDPGTLTTTPARLIPPSAKAKSAAKSTGTLAITCATQWSYVEKKDIFGSRIYRFNVETEWCWDTSTYKLTNVDRAVGYINYETWGINFTGWQVDSAGVRSTKWSGWHDKKASVQYCVGGDVGCYTTTYPYINTELGTTAGDNPWNWKVESSSAG
ncbi:hypothetical protein [Micromonospora sp. WMMD714]|uniref:hypothetical protein n=1 Tax=Micromonospora sp. WMMD714 TaxID=3016097 RepID=UPI00249A29F6|nr:hypothetical protein [Micromonospora sp. WMMD714]WFE64777.1 hypothetical protein O7625_16560 [Micromonospora sp. WMMD714]